MRYPLVATMILSGVLAIASLSMGAFASDSLEDIPSAVMMLQKRLSDLGLNISPCAAEESSGAEPLLCTNPIQAICGAYEAASVFQEINIQRFKADFAEQVERQIRATLGKDPKEWVAEASRKQDGEGVVSRQNQIFAIQYEVTEKLLFGLLKEKGWSKEAVEKLVEKAKAAQLASVRPGDSISAQRIKTLVATPWANAKVYSKLPELNQQATQRYMTSACGEDGLANAALVVVLDAPDDADFGESLDSGKPAVFIICPGLLLQAALSDLGPDSLIFTVGHELGHMFQPSDPPKGTRKIESLEDRRKVALAERDYEKAVQEAELLCPKFKGCFMRKELFSENFYLNSCDVNRVIKACSGDIQATQNKVSAIRAAARQRQDLIDQLTTPAGDTDRDRAFLRCLKQNDLNEMNNGSGQIAAFKKTVEPWMNQLEMGSGFAKMQLEAKQKELADFEKAWGRKPDSIDLHQRELVADYWGARAIESRMKELKDFSSRKQTLVSTLSPYCNSVKKQSKDTDVEEHPPFGYRIERILSNPGIRSSLGCKSASPRVWCER